MSTIRGALHGTSNQCLLYPQKRTLELRRGMSALCQKQTHALQYNFSGVAGFASKNLYQPILGLSLWAYASDIAGQGAGYEGKSILCDGGRVVLVGLCLFAEFYHWSF